MGGAIIIIIGLALNLLGTWMLLNATAKITENKTDKGVVQDLNVTTTDKKSDGRGLWFLLSGVFIQIIGIIVSYFHI